MDEKNRQYKRIEKPLTMQFCIADAYLKKWDMTTIENISVGGIKFSVSSDLKIADKVIQLQIKIPQLAPGFLELQALVLSAVPRLNSPTSDVRAKFINLSEKNIKDLSVVEGIINAQAKKIVP